MKYFRILILCYVVKVRVVDSLGIVRRLFVYNIIHGHVVKFETLKNIINIKILSEYLSYPVWGENVESNVSFRPLRTWS